MGHTEIIVAMEDGHLLPQSVFTLAQRADPAPDRGDMLADAEVEPLHKGRVDVPAMRSQHGIDRLQGAEHHAVLHPHQAPAPHGLQHLRVEQLRLWHPTRLRRGACDLSPWWLYPVPIVRQ